MKRLISTKGMERSEWLDYRKKGIGGSDAGAICGLNPYRTAIQVYLDKTSDATEDIDNEAMRQGRDFEEYVAKRFTEITGKKVRRAHAMFYHEKYPFMLADVDRLVLAESAGLEYKTASPYMAEHWADGKIPLSYQIQCYHYMATLGMDCWYLAVLIYGKDFRFFRLDRDEEMIQNLIQIEQDFWEKHVKEGVMPEPDGSRLADTILADYFKESRPIALPLTGFEEKLNRRREIISVMDKMETEKKQIEQELKLYLGEAEMAENEHYRVSWKPVISNRLDEKRLKEERPEIYAQYQKQTQSRRFLIKSA